MSDDKKRVTVLESEDGHPLFLLIPIEAYKETSRKLHKARAESRMHKNLREQEYVLMGEKIRVEQEENVRLRQAIKIKCSHPSETLWKLHHVSGGDTSFIYEDYWCRKCGAIGIRPAGDRRNTEIKWHLPERDK